MKNNQHILKSVLDECNKHVKRMQIAYKKISSLFPVTKERISKLKEDEISYIDKIIYRFSKFKKCLKTDYFG